MNIKMNIITGKRTDKKRVYFAAPLFNSAEKNYNLNIAAVLEKAGYEVFLPQRDGYEAAAMSDKTEEEKTALIFNRDTSEIYKSDALFMVLDGRVPDEGACVELGIAYASGKSCYAIKSDARALEYGMDINPLLSGCFTKIFRPADGKSEAETLERYLFENAL